MLFIVEYRGTIEQSPAVNWCFVMCNQSLYQANQNGLHSLIFRVKRADQIMMLQSKHFQDLSNQGQVPVIVHDAYNSKRYLWRPNK